MPFNSSNPRHAHYFENPAVLMDTCALTWFAKHAGGILEISRIMERYHVLVPTTVLYELAFGLPEARSDEENSMRQLLFDREHEIEMLQYGMLTNQKLVRPNGFSIINPGYNEWWTARERILEYVSLSGARAGKSKQALSMDALIHACARNCFAPICTENIADFARLNQAGAKRTYDGTVPLFTPQDVLDSLTTDVQSRDQN